MKVWNSFWLSSCFVVAEIKLGFQARCLFSWAHPEPTPFSMANNVWHWIPWNNTPSLCSLLEDVFHIFIKILIKRVSSFQYFLAHLKIHIIPKYLSQLPITNWSLFRKIEALPRYVAPNCLMHVHLGSEFKHPPILGFNLHRSDTHTYFFSSLHTPPAARMLLLLLFNNAKDLLLSIFISLRSCLFHTILQVLLSIFYLVCSNKRKVILQTFIQTSTFASKREKNCCMPAG